MSVHIEWLHAASTRPRYVQPNRDVVNGDEVDPDVNSPWGDERVTGTDEHGLVLSADEMVVLHGSLDAIRKLLVRALEALPVGEVDPK